MIAYTGTKEAVLLFMKEFLDSDLIDCVVTISQTDGIFTVSVAVPS